MERLLAALASSVGVALSNARLFDETKRLLADTNERAAELAVINEIGEALGKQLDFDAIIQLVGHRVHEQYDAENMFIALRNPATNTIVFPFVVEEGQQAERQERPMGTGLTSRVIETARPIRMGSSEASDAAGAIQAGTVDYMESWIGVPIAGQNRVIGVLAMEAAARDAYTESDERVLATLASGMGVALENARLFDETKRLLADTDQRAAELAVINEIGEALAKQLDFGAIIQLVGDRVRSLFSANSMAIALHDPATNLLSWPYDLDEGEIFHREPRPLGPGMTSQVLASGRPMRVGTMAEQVAAGAIPGRRHGDPVVARRPHHRSEPGDRRPLARVTPRGCLLGSRRARPRDAGLEHGRGARERAPVRRDEAPVQGGGRARRGARDHQRGPAGPRLGNRHADDVRPGRRAAARDLRRSGPGHRDPGPRRRPAPLPVHHRTRRAVPRRAHRADRDPQARHGDAGAHARERARDAVAEAWASPAS